MYGKEFIVDVLRTFFMVVALINVVMLVFGTMYAPDMQFGYEVFKSPLIYGAAGTLPNIVMYSKRELNVKELMVRKVLQLVLIEAIVLFVAFYNQSAFWQQPYIIITIAICIVAIYVIASLVDWVQNTINAKKMNAELMSFQKGVKVYD